MDHLVLHTWEETLDYSLFADSLDAVIEAIDGRPHEEEGRNFSLPMPFLEDNQRFLEGRTVMFPNFSLKAKWNIRVSNSFSR